MALLVIAVLVFALRLIGIVMGPPEGLNYQFEGGDAILEYGEDGVAWLWLRGRNLTGELTLPEGKWTSSVVLPPCSEASETRITLEIAELALTGTLGFGQQLQTKAMTFGIDSEPIEVTSSQEPCTLADDGRTVSVGVFFEPLDGPVLMPEIASAVPTEKSSDGRTWIWSTSPSLSGTMRLGPRAGSWAIDVSVPSCGQDRNSPPVGLSFRLGDSLKSHTVLYDQSVTRFIRPTVTKSVPFVVTVDSASCTLPDDGREAYFLIVVRPVNPTPI